MVAAGQVDTNEFNPADSAIILDAYKYEDFQEALIAVLYLAYSSANRVTLPQKDSPGIYGCSSGSGTSNLYLQLANYSNSATIDSGVSETDLFDLIDKANSDAQAKHKNEPNGNPYFINTRFIESVTKQGNNLKIVSAQHVGSDSNNFPSARWQYTVHLFDLKITSSQYLGKIDYNN